MIMLPFFTRETAFVTSSFHFGTILIPFEKGVFIRNEFAPSGSKFIPYREDLFQKEQKKKKKKNRLYWLP